MKICTGSVNSMGTETKIVVGYHSEMLAGAFAFVLFVRSHDCGGDRAGPSEKRHLQPSRPW